jgi:hypothetical protein
MYDINPQLAPGGVELCLITAEVNAILPDLFQIFPDFLHPFAVIAPAAGRLPFPMRQTAGSSVTAKSRRDAAESAALLTAQPGRDSKLSALT